MQPQEPGEELQHLLEGLRREGVLDSQGVFTAAQEDALSLLSTRLLQKPERYLLKFVQAAVAAGAREVRVNLRLNEVDVTATGAADLELPSHDWVSASLSSASGPLKHLLTGVLGAWDMAREIRVEWGAQGCRFQPQRGLDPEVSPRAYPDGQVRMRVVRRRPRWNRSPRCGRRCWNCVPHPRRPRVAVQLFGQAPGWGRCWERQQRS